MLSTTPVRTCSATVSAFREHLSRAYTDEEKYRQIVVDFKLCLFPLPPFCSQHLTKPLNLETPKYYFQVISTPSHCLPLFTLSSILLYSYPIFIP